MDFTALLDAAKANADAEPAARQQAVRDALAAARDTDGDTPNLAELEHAAAEAFAKLSDDDAVLDETVFTEMGMIADVVDAIRAEAGDQQAQRVADIASRIGTPSISAQPPAPAAPAAPAAPQANEPSPSPAQPEPPAQPDTSSGDEPPAEPAAPVDQQDKELVVASAPRRTVARVQPQVPLSALPKQLPAGPGQGATNAFTITAAADVPGFNLGSELDTETLTRAVMARFQQLSRGGGDHGGSRSGIAAINIERDEQFVAKDQYDWQVVERACDETRLPGGSLLAAVGLHPEMPLTASAPLEAPASTPGWCAPCTPTYEFCPIASVYGTIDLPMISAPRGCISWPVSPQFHEIYSGTGWCYTPEQIDNMQLPVHPTWDGTPPEPPGGPWYNPTIGPAQKDCYKIPCPPNEDMVLEPCGLCIQASILHERAYPELIRYTVSQALVAHAHKMNCRVLCSMESQAVRVTMPPEGPAAAAAGSNFGPGAVAYTLEAIELQVEWLRYRHRLGLDTTIEMVAPAWMRGILRADLSKRMGVDLLSVTNQMLVNYLALRGVRVQFVVDWQDAFCTDETVTNPAPPPATLPATVPESARFGGGATPQTAWPAKATVLLYPAGTYFMARMDIINLEGGLLDSTLLRKNERIVLFTEEAMAVGKRCYEAIALEIPLCPSGQTGSGAWTQCATQPKPPITIPA